MTPIPALVVAEAEAERELMAGSRRAAAAAAVTATEVARASSALTYKSYAADVMVRSDGLLTVNQPLAARSHAAWFEPAFSVATERRALSRRRNHCISAVVSVVRPTVRIQRARAGGRCRPSAAVEQSGHRAVV